MNELAGIQYAQRSGYIALVFSGNKFMWANGKHNVEDHYTKGSYDQKVSPVTLVEWND